MSELIQCVCHEDHSVPEVHDSDHFTYVECGRCGARGAYVERSGADEREGEAATMLWNELMSAAKAGKAACAVLAERKNIAFIADSLISDIESGEKMYETEVMIVCNALKALAGALGVQDEN